MNLSQQIYHLYKKEILLEWRQKYAIGSILLYVAATTFLVFYTVGGNTGRMAQGMGSGGAGAAPANSSIWLGFFWVIVLFTTVNAATKSFVGENGPRRMYHYVLADPVAVILAKMFYTSSLLLLLSLLTFGLYTLFMGNPVQEPGVFMLALLLGSTGLGFAFAFLSAIASKTANSAALLAVLGFPVILPTLLLLVRITKFALYISFDNSWGTDALLLLALNIITVGMGVILFPFLWRD